jgi:HAE1 family hydrophobic/amphiphilic exporter-1
MFSKFFIERPVLSNVIAVITMLLGAVALYNLPIAQYPDITPPTVVISTSYPGANPDVVAETVGAPIEQQVNGVEKMLFMSSKSASDGSYNLTVTFEVGTNLDIATVLLQNRINSAMPRLPQEVQRQGVTVKKRSPDILVVLALTSPDGRYDSLFLSNFGLLNVQDEIARVQGVGDLRVFGADEYAMRIWLDPAKLKALRLSAQDVVGAIAQQNVQVASGLIGQPPAPSGQNFQYTIQTKGRLADEAEFGEIIVKDARGPSDKVVRVKDVARVELGGRSYDLFAQYKGKPAALMPIFLQPGANALDVSTRVLQRMDELAKDFPEGLSWANAFDTTIFVRQAVHDVYMTLLIAAGLVLVVIMLFLQDWRAMLVPATTVPVTILGSFIAMAWLGFS